MEKGGGKKGRGIKGGREREKLKAYSRPEIVTKRPLKCSKKEKTERNLSIS